MATIETAWNTSHGPVRYYRGDVEVMLGDRIELRGLIRRRRGSINYVPGISDPHAEMEHNGLFWVGLTLDDETFTGLIVDPDTGCLRKRVAFLGRGAVESLKPVPEAPFA